MSRRQLLIAFGVLWLLLGVGVTLWIVYRDPPHHGPDPHVAVDTVPRDDELERLRLDVEAARHAEIADLPGDPLPSERRPELARLAALDFSHAQHRNLDCLVCHSVEQQHGTVVITELRQCRECHHTGELAANCTACHGPDQFRGERHLVSQTFNLSAGPTYTRQIVFSHIQHQGLSCTDCHRAPLTMGVTVGCAGCHEQHHAADTQCMACHTNPPRGAHTVQAHVGCAGAGCHEPVPGEVAGVPRTRNLCLGCHQEMINHFPRQNCADCHRLPPPAPLAAGAVGAQHLSLLAGGVR